MSMRWRAKKLLFFPFFYFILHSRWHLISLSILFTLCHGTLHREISLIVFHWCLKVKINMRTMMKFMMHFSLFQKKARTWNEPEFGSTWLSTIRTWKLFQIILFVFCLNEQRTCKKHRQKTMNRNDCETLITLNFYDILCFDERKAKTFCAIRMKKFSQSLFFCE